MEPRLDYRRQWLIDIDARSVREECGIRRITIAHALGIHHSNVWYWENGIRTPVSEAGEAYLRVIAGLLRHINVDVEIDIQDYECSDFGQE